MAYIAATDFRQGSSQDFTAGITLAISEAEDSALSAAIVRLSKRLDDYTNDHFEPESAAVVEVSVRGISNRLYLPKRARVITTVKIRDSDGVLTTEAASVYRLKSSLNSAGTSKLGERDYLEILDGKVLVGGSTWPVGTHTVQVTGDFGWVSTPGDIKRALALMVWDHFKPETDKLRRTVRVVTEDRSMDFAASEPTGMPEVDRIIAEYRRSEPIGVA